MWNLNSLKKLKKPELLKEAIKMQATIETFDDEENILNKLDRLEMKLKEANDLFIKQDDSIYLLEKQVYQLQQYTRRENIEIIGLPENVKDLEATVIEILNKIGVDVTSFDIAACHRLKKRKGSRYSNVIVRFVSRKKAILCLQNKKHLQSPYNYCHKMKMEKNIVIILTFNGVINFKKTEDDEIHKIFHYDELYDHFPDSDD